ncbi:hypothetical protein [Burkholderia ubonensis]|uniref:hypothetical protein n=1 Tax=Burkholderia ubonensis TaxID=101571 RepID=UPI0012FA15AF|nr:hypothetical protein [Burkholderia ubonensis]
MARPRPSWPSIDDQLSRHGVRPGTELEQLVRKNQDFQLLHPSEAEDDLHFPPWLRVYWRKQHPDVQPKDGDPTRGYPLVLHRVLRWMLSNQDHPNLRGSTKR